MNYSGQELSTLCRIAQCCGNHFDHCEGCPAISTYGSCAAAFTKMAEVLTSFSPAIQQCHDCGHCIIAQDLAHSTPHFIFVCDINRALVEPTHHCDKWKKPQ